MGAGRTSTHSEDHCTLNNASNRDADITKTPLYVLNARHITLKQVDSASQGTYIADNRLGHFIFMSTP